MWIEELDNGKYKYFERYKDEYNHTKRVSITLDKNTKQAQNQASRMLLEKIQEKTKSGNATSALFWEVAKDMEKIETHTLKPATIRNRKVARHKLALFIPEKTLLIELKQSQVLDILENLYYEENYSLESISNFKAYISNVYKYAIKRGYNVENPTKNCTIVPKIKTIDELENDTPKYLETEELREVLHLVDAKNHRYALLFEFLALTGLRIGEALGLTCKDYQGDFIAVTGTYDRYVRQKITPKNKSSYRKVSLSKRARTILDEIIQTNITLGNNQGKSSDPIWTNQRNGTIIFDSNIGIFLRRLDYQKKKLSTHIFRHTHISILTELNIPLKAIMDRVGHTNPKTTLKIYTHVTNKMKNDIIDKLDNLPLFCPQKNK
ncbi:site-specific integrase [Streptococcus gallolyticus]|nr:site-specific integrase [Streptococcus gallolyticus]MBY5040416.1 site-specific integrase [Streptococcus gallolyticus]